MKQENTFPVVGLGFYGNLLFMSDSYCCGAAPVSACCGTKIHMLCSSSAEIDTGLGGECPRREGRGGTVFGKQDHLVDVASSIMISEVIG